MSEELTASKYIDKLKSEAEKLDGKEKELLLAKIEGAEAVMELNRRYGAEWREENREHIRDYQRKYHQEYRQKNADKYREYQREYHREYRRRKLAKTN